MSDKLCPLMTRPYREDEANYMNEVECVENSCQLWIEVFTTENIRIQGCAIELQPQMVNGQFRV